MLADSLKILLATNFAYYLKAHGFHWNVEGPDFSELHGFFQEIYEDAYSAIDPTAEYIRYLGEYSPASFERFSELTEISGQTKIPRARLMLEELKANNDQMLDLLNRCFAEANDANEQGIANFIAERLSAHGKYRWQLTSYLKVERA
ncbi:MAG: DNA starvation/stationary phase protection protein [Micrococcales bacterium]|jgi:starvation-inducible DNA-binding protein|nr:DNA starvation/stationary phase protection protein [Micrococcales bacterium]